MNQTTELFLTQLKSKQLGDYNMAELQIQLQECSNLYERFGKSVKNIEERLTLNTVWNKMATRYNELFKEKYPDHDRPIYKIDWMIENLPRKTEQK